MSKNQYELHEERLATTSESGHRIFLFPEEVKGLWKKRRTFFYWFLIIFYLVLPWIHIGGKQSIKLDIINGEFTFFSYSFFASNAPLLVFFFLGFVFTIGFITSIWGRVWCGWACPQTVFIETIYRKIESLIEGKSRQRFKLDGSPWNFEKIWKRSLKWFLYILVSLHISHTFLGYFVGTHELLQISLHSPSEHFVLFTIMLIITAIFLLDFGWFREQFCIIACPYGRFQSVMMDDNTMTVVYDAKRGEPRRQIGQTKEEHADCVNCYACVKVCPTGIDIRRGLQLECIACTNCIDACDDVMLKTNRPTGLIRYDSQANIDGTGQKTLRPRNIAYLGAIIVIIVGMIYSINLSTDLGVTILKGPGSPYTEVHNDPKHDVINLFQITFDQSGNIDEKEIFVDIANKDELEIEIKTQRNPLVLNKNHTRVNFFFKFNSKILINGIRNIELTILDKSTGKQIIREVPIVGPIR